MVVSVITGDSIPQFAFNFLENNHLFTGSRKLFGSVSFSNLLRGEIFQKVGLKAGEIKAPALIASRILGEIGSTFPIP
jgi:hypothetical protein